MRCVIVVISIVVVLGLGLVLYFGLTVTSSDSQTEANLSYTTGYPSSDGYYLLDGQTMTLFCTYDVERSIHHIRWYVNGHNFFSIFRGRDLLLHEYRDTNRFVNTSFTHAVSRLTLNLNKTTDEGSIFECEIEYEADHGHHNYCTVTMKEILVPPESVTLERIPYVIQDTSSTIKCEVTSVYRGQDVTEFRLKVGDTYLPATGTEIESTAGEVNGTFTLTYTQMSHFMYSPHQGQQVQCEVTWMNGTSVETIVTSDPQALEVYYAPVNVVLDVSTNSVDTDDTITFNCSTSSNPNPRMRLYRRRQGQSTPTVVQASDRALTITVTLMMSKIDNQVKFWCRADDNNSISGWGFDIQSVIEVINVMHPPEVYIKAHPTQILEGSELLLECEVESNPVELPLFKWEFKRKYANKNNHSQALVTQQEARELKIERTVYTDAGVYTCTAQNELGIGDGEIQIDIQYTPRMLNEDQDVVVSSMLNQPVKLSLTVMAFPEFTDLDTAFRWARSSGQELSKNASVSSVRIISEVFQSTLTIENVIEEDYGDYTVTMTNGVKDPVSVVLTLEQQRAETVVEEAEETIQTLFTLTTGGTVWTVLAAIVVTVLLMLVVIWFLRKHKTNGSHSGSRDHQVQDGMGHYEGLDHKTSDTTEQPSYETIEEGNIYEEVDYSKTGFISGKLQTSDLIHKGRYTNILKGVLTYRDTAVPVIVKCNKDNFPENETQYLLNTISCIRKLSKHRHIVETFNVEDVSATLVMRYYEGGDLKQFLTQKKKAAKTGEDVDINLLQLALTAARGLAFLDLKKPDILHFQLCAEHVLVDHTESCRLTGFDYKPHVIQREMEEESQGFCGGGIAWKAPEVISDCKAHSKSSDVWAFGVLLYEIYTMGDTPYEWMPECDIETYVRSGQVLTKPKNCPLEIYGIMKSCWTYAADQRQGFQKLLERLERKANSKTSQHPSCLLPAVHVI